MVRAMIAQAAGRLEAVDAVNPLEALGNRPGLVRLQLADEVPLQRQVREGRHLGDCLLNVVFPEIRDAGGGGSPQ